MSRIMSEAGLAFYPCVALIIFLSVYASVMARTFQRSARREQDHAARLAIDEAPVVPQSTEATPSQTQPHRTDNRMP
jgi:cbb3-type cytochrome oxidase subunit 3